MKALPHSIATCALLVPSTLNNSEERGREQMPKDNVRAAIPQQFQHLLLLLMHWFAEVKHVLLLGDWAVNELFSSQVSLLAMGLLD